jgi:hypothetical protein
MSVVIDGATGITTPGIVNTGSETVVNLTTSGNTVLGDATTDTLTVGVTGIVKDASGNVGIGTTNTTDQRLKVKQSADTGAASFSFKVEANANDTGLYIGYRGVGAATAADTCAITASYNSTGGFKPLTFLTSDAERVRIDTSGNVGIGTSSPTAYGGYTSLALNNTTGGVLDFSAAGTVQGQIFSSATEMRFTKIGANFMTFYTNGGERMRIDSSGMVLPGATATYDLGSTSLRWRNVYTSDLHLNNGIGNYTIVEGEEDLFLYNNKNGKAYKFALIEVDKSEAPPKMKES